MAKSQGNKNALSPTNGLCCHVETSQLDSEASGRLDDVVSALCAKTEEGDCVNLFRGYRREALPSSDIVGETMEALRSILFPGYFGVSEMSADSMRFYVGATLDQVIRVLNVQIRRGLCFVCAGDTPERCADCEVKGAEISQAFLERLPHVQGLLQTDVVAAFEGDPAATTPDEAIFCYPGIRAITNYRIAHELHLLGVPILPRIISERAHSVTGIDIHPGATIGERFFIDHGTGVVIGETCQIGKRVTIYQGVTLGAKSFPLDSTGNPIKGVPRHPIVEDDVVIYSGATILGRVTIGAKAEIGGNVWLTRSVSPGSRITQAQVRQDRFDQGGGI